MNGKEDTMDKVQVTKTGHIVNVQKICVKLINGEEICGVVNIAEYECDRLSDFLGLETNKYIILNKCSGEHKTMFINRKHILWAVPQPSE